MKKFILLISIFILSSNFSYADTGDSTVSWGSNSLGTECGTTISHGMIHNGIPNSNSSTAGASGTSGCKTHSYYASSQYTVYYSGFKGCNSGDRAINIGNNAPTTGNLTCWKYDDTNPTLGSLNIGNNNSQHLLADNSYPYNFTISVGPNEAPITKATGKLNGNPINISCNTPAIGSGDKTTTCTMTWDIRDVDSNRSNNGGREYIFSLDTVCDEAGNCSSSTDTPKIFTHYVYANTIDPQTYQISVNNNLSNDSNIADGTTKTLSILLKDKYGNAIVPAPGINRNIDFNFDVINTMFLNQINKNDGNSVFVKRPDSTIYENNLLNTGNPSITITTYQPVGASYGSGQYDFEFKVYTPTASQNNGPVSDVNAKFNISSINVDINSSRNILNGANPEKVGIGANNINAKFSPLYYTEITGDGGNIKDNGIIEGGFQESKIKVQKNGSTSSSNNQLLLSYGSSKEGKNDAEKFIMHAGSTEENSNSTTINSVPTTINTNPGFPNSGGISTNLYTRLIQVQTVNTDSNIYLATHIKYEITNPNGHSYGDLNVRYNSDIVGKASYWGAAEDAIGKQAGIKIIGLTATHSSTNLVEGQFINDIYTLDSNYTKSTLKTQLIKNGYEFARNLVGNDNIPLTSIDDPSFNNINMINNVIYFGKTAGNIAPTIYKLGNNSNENIKISEKRTILVIGGDLYINSNLYYSGNGMLGIMVLKDANGNGGNVYINPNVTNIVGSIFAEKSIISYNGTELDGLTPASTLKNQLHIYGSIFSENTIGGSRENTPKCPFYVNITDCTLEVAQKYDLNYLRRYYLIKDGAYFKPANNGKLIGGGTYSSFGNVTPTSTNYARKIEKTSDEYAKYPVVVEYNPRTQTSIPPLFLIK